MQQNTNEIEINGVKYVPKSSVQDSVKLNTKDAVIVRCRTAGVFFGYKVDSALANGIITLKNARRLWYWSGAASLSQLAVDGTGNPKDCKFPTPVPEITLTEVIEVIPCTDKAVTSISEVQIWKA